jgi:hypothetical protein
MDGFFETRRFYSEGLLGLSESDWNQDGYYEYGEEYLPDGTVLRSLDLDLDGVREAI